jgi:hypothetical protein
MAHLHLFNPARWFVLAYARLNSINVPGRNAIAIMRAPAYQKEDPARPAAELSSASKPMNRSSVEPVRMKMNSDRLATDGGSRNRRKRSKNTPEKIPTHATAVVAVSQLFIGGSG